VKVLFDDGVLTIKGERKVEKEEKATRCIARALLRHVRAELRASRDVDVKLIRAESKEGVLYIHLPRVAVEKARRWRSASSDLTDRGAAGDRAPCRAAQCGCPACSPPSLECSCVSAGAWW